MRQLPLTLSLLSFLDDLEYTEAALLADEEAADLAQPFAEEIESWAAIFKTEREARREVTRSEAVVAVKNSVLDSTTVRFGASVLAEAGADRKSTLFRRFFPVAPSELTRRPLRKQAELTLNVMLAEIEKLASDSPLRAFSSPLGDLAKAALTALDARAKVKSGRGITSHDVEEWKEGANTLRLSTYAELLKRAAENGRGRAWPDAFFRAEGTIAAVEEGDPLPGAPVPAAPVPTPA